VIVTADPITLQLKVERLRFETGLDVNAIIHERDAYKEALVEVCDFATVLMAEKGIEL
jgi:hypothetical protein